METFILDSFGATIKLTIFLCMIVIFIVKSMTIAVRYGIIDDRKEVTTYDGAKKRD